MSEIVKYGKNQSHRREMYEKSIENLPYTTNGCSTLAVSRALADDPSDADEVAKLAPAVHGHLDGVNEYGSYRVTRTDVALFLGTGHATVLASDAGIPTARSLHPMREVLSESSSTDDFDFGQPTGRCPTLTQFLRGCRSRGSLDDTLTAIVWTSGHFGYVDLRGGGPAVGYSVGPRHRIRQWVSVEKTEEWLERNNAIVQKYDYPKPIDPDWKRKLRERIMSP